MSGVAHFFMVVDGSKIHERPAHFFIDIYIRRYEDGASIPELCQEFHIAISTAYHWIKTHRTIQTPQRTYTPFEFDAISRRLKKLEHELEIIHLTHYLEQIPLQLVQQIFDDSGQRYGAEKIRVVLTENGIRTSRKRVSAIMQELDLRSVRTDSKKEFKKRQKYAKQNLLQQNFKAGHPNQIWVSDITCFKVNGYWLYFCVILDLYSRKVIGWKVSRNASTQLVTSTFKSTYEKREQPKDLTFHSDRGVQYTSAAFSKLLQKHHVKQSFSASGRPQDNAVAETFFATFKKEEAYRGDYSSEQGFRKSVEQFVEFYNEVRPHRTLAYKTPSRFEELYHGQ